MLRRLLASGLLAGFLAAVAYTAVQAIALTPLILQAETYETGGAPAHGAGDLPAFGYAPAPQPIALRSVVEAGSHAPTEAWAPADGLERTLYSGLANLVSGVGFAFLLVAAYALSRRAVDGREGVFWGAAGFAVFALAPALGLPPELPGSLAADLGARQAWWAATAVATALGLGLLVFAPGRPAKALGLVVLALPHLVGAPHPAGPGAGLAPPELAARFAVLSLASSALFWAVLGWTSGSLYRRLG